MGIKVEQALLARIDREAVKQARATPGLTVSRTDIVTILLNEALAAREAGARK